MSEKDRFTEYAFADHHPVLDQKKDRLLSRSELIEVLNDLSEKADRAPPIENGENNYGLDVGYFRKTINRELNQSLRDFKPSELARVLARLSVAADKEVIKESEFAGDSSKGDSKEDFAHPMDSADLVPAVPGLHCGGGGETKFERAFWAIYNILLAQDELGYEVCASRAIQLAGIGFDALNKEVER